MLETAMLKVFSTDVLWRIINDTIQIFGGKAYFSDEPYERMMRDARINMIGEGANDVLRVFTALVGMRDVGLELKSVLDAAKRPFSNLGKLSDSRAARSNRCSAHPASTCITPSSSRTGCDWDDSSAHSAPRSKPYCADTRNRSWTASINWPASPTARTSCMLVLASYVGSTRCSVPARWIRPETRTANRSLLSDDRGAPYSSQSRRSVDERRRRNDQPGRRAACDVQELSRVAGRRETLARWRVGGLPASFDATADWPSSGRRNDRVGTLNSTNSVSPRFCCFLARNPPQRLAHAQTMTIIGIHTPRKAIRPKRRSCIRSRIRWPMVCFPG